MQEVYILPLKKPGLRYTGIYRIYKKKVEHTLSEEIILNENRLGGSPLIKGTLFHINSLIDSMWRKKKAR